MNDNNRTRNRNGVGRRRLRRVRRHVVDVGFDRRLLPVHGRKAENHAGTHTHIYIYILVYVRTCVIIRVLSPQGIHVGQQKPEHPAGGVLADGQFHVGDHVVRRQRRELLARHAVRGHQPGVRPGHADNRVRVLAGVLQTGKPVRLRSKTCRPARPGRCKN